VATQSGASVEFAESVAQRVPFGAALARSANYFVGSVAYIIGPLIFLAALRPSWSALADTAWPSEELRRQAWVLLLVPLILPALVNLAVPYRLTAAWTSPNWAVLPIVLYGSRALFIDERATVRAGLFTLAATLAILIASPVIACVSGLPFYLPQAKPLMVGPLSAEGRAAVSAEGLLVVCIGGDEGCRKNAKPFIDAGAPSKIVTLTRSFLGFSSRPVSFQITAAPPG
jgi:hypothetical protein